ncbi:unnamed protein product, partial [Rotaria magnacalcarata]
MGRPVIEKPGQAIVEPWVTLTKATG